MCKDFLQVKIQEGFLIGEFCSVTYIYVCSQTFIGFNICSRRFCMTYTLISSCPQFFSTLITTNHNMNGTKTSKQVKLNRIMISCILLYTLIKQHSYYHNPPKRGQYGIINLSFYCEKYTYHLFVWDYLRFLNSYFIISFQLYLS